MRVNVQFFAQLRELAGCRAWTCDVPEGATVDAVWRAAAEAHPGIGVMEASISCAVNAEFAARSTIVHAGADVAFLPPVSGG